MPDGAGNATALLPHITRKATQYRLVQALHLHVLEPQLLKPCRLFGGRQQLVRGQAAQARRAAHEWRPPGGPQAVQAQVRVGQAALGAQQGQGAMQEGRTRAQVVGGIDTQHAVEGPRRQAQRLQSRARTFTQRHTHQAH